MKYFIIAVVATVLGLASYGQAVLPAAHQTHQYVPLLKGKRVAVFANQTSQINSTHLVDSLQKLGITITKIFGPEHGFRGTADAGEKVGNYFDKETGIPVISLYGKKRKIAAADVLDVDVIVFDIQDVGVRFYTYISSLQELMESAVELEKEVVILDRPNPNGHYVDGPVLDTVFKSFIGMQPVPVVYGLTIGEYAHLLAGEGWLSVSGSNKYRRKSAQEFTIGKANFTIVKNQQYTHSSAYSLPVKPSPNLPDDWSITLYPSTCFFEGTVLSEGRGTEHPFGIFGHPSLPNNLFTFTPVSTAGSKEPKLKNQVCYGYNLYQNKEALVSAFSQQVNLQYLLTCYQQFPQKDSFFLPAKSGKDKDYFFNKLAGNAQLKQQIQQGVSEADIRKSWQPALNAFKKIRKKYLLYPDFE